MRVAGIGFRRNAPQLSLREALERATASPVQLLATIKDKATAPQFTTLAKEMNLSVHAVAPETLAAQTTMTQSPRVIAMTGAGSVAEAAALAAAGPGARLLGKRVASADGMATAAIAEGPGI